MAEKFKVTEDGQSVKVKAKKEEQKPAEPKEEGGKKKKGDK